MITLVDEDGQESLTKYLAEKTGLSGGWRGFAIDHRLVDGDALVFQLIKPTEFKVSSWSPPFRDALCINVECHLYRLLYTL